MTAKTLWMIVFGVAVLVIMLITNMFQPAGVVISYDAASYFEVRKLFFAAGVLAVLGFMLILSIAVYMSLSQSNPASTAGKDIFDSMVKVVPPIITLVLGYYFGQQSAVKTIPDNANPASIQANKDTSRDPKQSAEAKGAQNTNPINRDTKVTTPATPTDSAPISPSGPAPEIKK